MVNPQSTVLRESHVVIRIAVDLNVMQLTAYFLLLGEEMFL
jgi:hypothetical protein